MRPISVVVPIHNEIKYLPYFLPSLRQIEPDEIIFLMDRCNDGSIDFIKKTLNPIYHPYKIITVNDKEGTNWNRRVGYLRRVGYFLAKNEIILTCDADMILDYRIPKYHAYIDDETKYIGFGFFDKPLNLKSILRNLFAYLLPIEPYSGLYMFSRDAWIETENLDEARESTSEDAHLKLAIETKYKTRHYLTTTKHLRTSETREHDKMRGRNYALTVKAPTWKVVLMSLAMLRPHMLLEYLKTKKNQ